MKRMPASTRMMCNGRGEVAVNQKRTQAPCASAGGSAGAPVGAPADAGRIPPWPAGLPARIPLVPAGLRLLATALVSEVANQVGESPLLKELHHLRLQRGQQDLRRDRGAAVADDFHLR